MSRQTLELTEAEIVEKGQHKIKRYPNLNTVLMVEDFLKKHRDIPMKISEIKRKLPKQIMYETLKVVLEYLWRSGKIIYGPRGVQWVYVEPEHLRMMLTDTLEVGL